VLLYVTKIPAVVTLLAASLASGTLVLYGCMVTGFWDKFWVIALAFAWFYSAIVSLAFIGLGRWSKWPHFLRHSTKDEGSAL